MTELDRYHVEFLLELSSPNDWSLRLQSVNGLLMAKRFNSYYYLMSISVTGSIDNNVATLTKRHYSKSLRAY